MFIKDYEEQKYNQTFESVYKYLNEQKEHDKNYTVQQLEDFLDDLYFYEGDDWIGRGISKEIINSATIAACETLLTEWKSAIK